MPECVHTYIYLNRGIRPIAKEKHTYTERQTEQTEKQYMYADSYL